MKFSWKIFFITFLIIITSFGVGGFLLINTVFTNTLNNRIDSAKKNNNYITTALSVYADNSKPTYGNWEYLRTSAIGFAKQIAGNSDSKSKIGSINELSFSAEDEFAHAAYARSFDGQVEKSIQEGKAFFGTNVIALCQAADVVFLALHGENGENGKVQAAFDLLGIRYTGSGYLGSAIAMDKGLSKQLFWQNEVPTPAGFILKKGEDISLEAHGMTLPCVVKPCCGGSSVGVTIPKTQEEYEAAVADAFSYEDVIVVEEYIKGREFSVGVVDGIAYPIIEIAPIEGFYDYTNKYKAGSTVETCPAVLTKEQTEQMQAYAVKGFKALQLDNYGRLDFMMSKDGKMYCLEANTLPGMTPTSLLPQEAQALGMDFADLCEKLIAVSAK